MKNKKKYHKSRKIIILLFFFFFTYSVSMFYIKGKQRTRNLTIVEQLHNNKKAFDVVNKMSRNEDAILTIISNLIAIGVFLVADKKRMFE